MERPGEVTEDMTNAVVYLEPAAGAKVKTQARNDVDRAPGAAVRAARARRH